MRDSYTYKNLKNFWELKLDHSQVTKEGVNRLNKALPNCHIEWTPEP